VKLLIALLTIAERVQNILICTQAVCSMDLLQAQLNCAWPQGVIVKHVKEYPHLPQEFII